MPDTPGAPPRPRRVSRRRQIIGAVLCLLAFYVYYLFGSGKWMTFEIEGNSMVPTLLAGERVLVDLRPAPLVRGALVIFHDPRPEYQQDLLIKRVVAIGGDRFEVRDGLLYVNGQLEIVPGLIDPFVPDSGGQLGSGPATVPRDHVVVLGDNRETSFDSTEFGELRTDAVMGQVAIRIRPLARAGRVP